MTSNSYFAELEGERGESIRRVFATVRDAMPDGYELTDFRGSPSWVVPLSTYPVTYNKQPLSYVALIAQKNYNSLYLTLEDENEFQRQWAATGRKLNMGKSCLRFRTTDDVDLDIIASTIAATPVDELIASYARSRQA